MGAALYFLTQCEEDRNDLLEWIMAYQQRKLNPFLRDGKKISDYSLKKKKKEAAPRKF